MPRTRLAPGTAWPALSAARIRSRRGPAGDGHVDKLGRQQIRVELAKVRLTLLDARVEVGLGQALDAGEIHQREGGGAEALLASISAVGAVGDLRFPLARRLGEQVGIDAGANEVADQVDRIGLAVEGVAPQIGVGREFGCPASAPMRQQA